MPTITTFLRPAGIALLTATLDAAVHDGFIVPITRIAFGGVDRDLKEGIVESSPHLELHEVSAYIKQQSETIGTIARH